MTRTELEDAIKQLSHLLDEDESAEEKYQQYFEENPIVFKVLGFSHAYPKLTLPRSDGGSYKPDFLLERPDGLFEILDLKTPQEKLITSRRKSRVKFYSKIEDYISQVQEYAEYFNDSEYRNRVKDNYSLDVQASPEIRIIAGRDRNVDKKVLYQLRGRITPKPHICTYDEVLSSLQFHHATLFGHTENLPGASWHAIITARHLDVKRRKYLFDCGDTLAQNRWSIYLDERDRLTFELIDAYGKPYLASVQPGTCGFELDEQCYIACEFGSSDSFALLQILINNRIAAKLEVASPIAISSGFNFNKQTIGADIAGHNNGRFDMAALAVYNQVLDFTQRDGLTERLFEEFFAKP